MRAGSAAGSATIPGTSSNSAAAGINAGSSPSGSAMKKTETTSCTSRWADVA